MEKQHTHSLDKFIKLSNADISHQFQDLEEEFYGSDKYQKQLYTCNKNEQQFNRYSDILPYKQNIVTTGGGYYNASSITLLSGNKLIATQAPKPPFENFWKIVLNQNVGLIVMLCALDDPKRGKQADQYWPTSGNLKQGGITISLESIQKLGDQFQQRKLSVSDGDKKRNVSQIHWHGWQDFGVPSKESSSIVQKMTSQIFGVFKNNENVILHCSAGVGRTGTLIAIIDGIGLIDRGDKEISIFQITANIRRQRFGSIQTSPQYQFVYQFLRGHIQKK